MRKGILMALLLTLVLAGCSWGAKPQDADKEPGGEQNGAETVKQWDAPPPMQIDPEKQYFATLETSMGSMRIELFAKDAPQTVNNFVFLAREGFYEGVTFHRIIKDFMVQTGDPQGTGRGGPGYRFDDELPPKRPYTKGIVAMANSGPNTNGSQFFICHGENCGGLDRAPNYTQFGMVVEGLDVLDKLASVEVYSTPDSYDPVPSTPKEPPTIIRVTIDEVAEAEETSEAEEPAEVEATAEAEEAAKVEEAAQPEGGAETKVNAEAEESAEAGESATAGENAGAAENGEADETAETEGATEDGENAEAEKE